MKKQVFVIGAFLAAVVLAVGCGSNSAKNNTTADSGEHQHSYRCPMNCEKGKTYDKEGRCPVCGMKLEHYDGGTDNGLVYKMEFAASPAQLEAGKAATLSFTPKVVGNESEAVPLDVQHEKKIHLIVVSNDLGYFEHIHPEYQADGSYRINVLEKGKPYSNGAGNTETRFDFGGDFTLFADYLPSGGSHQVEKVQFSVKGAPKAAVTYQSEKLNGSSDNFTVTLKPTAGSIFTGAQMHIAGVLMKDGKEVDVNTLENYLGAKAHMVVISLEDKEYLHVHPEVEGGKFDLHTTFQKPGIYRGWIQFKSAGKVHTVDFVMNVKIGSAEDLKKAEDSHDDGRKHSH